MKSIIVSLIATAGLIAAGNTVAADMPDLAKKSGCTACHSIDKKMVGPAWRDVSKAYNKAGATGSAVDPSAYKLSSKVTDILAEAKVQSPEEWLTHKVAKGGKGNWGTMAMTANAPKVSDADIKTLVEFVLGLEK